MYKSRVPARWVGGDLERARVRIGHKSASHKSSGGGAKVRIGAKSGGSLLHWRQVELWLAEDAQEGTLCMILKPTSSDTVCGLLHNGMAISSSSSKIYWCFEQNMRCIRSSHTGYRQ